MLNARSTKEYREMNHVLLAKGDERYVFVYGEGDEAEVLRTLGRFAINPDLSFTWFDAAKLSCAIQGGK